MGNTIPKGEWWVDPFVLKRMDERRRWNGSCLEWTGSLQKGYGVMAVRGKNMRVHRIAWAIANGQNVPGGKMVCHSCDNTKCSNPEHLFLGDNVTNAIDMVSKGRARGAVLKGEQNPRAILTEADVVKCRKRQAAGETHSALAREYGVSVQSMWRAIKGLSWRHLEQVA